MSAPGASKTFFVGWDVGGWDCDRNAKSRDALVILDEALRIVGGSWRGNLRDAVNASGTTRDFVGRLFGLCAEGPPPDGARVTLAIDTPLGFSREPRSRGRWMGRQPTPTEPRRRQGPSLSVGAANAWSPTRGQDTGTAHGTHSLGRG